MGLNGIAGYLRLPVHVRPAKRFTRHSLADRVPGYVRLLRPLNAIMSGVAVAVGAVVAIGLPAAAGHWLSVGLGALVAFLFTGAGNALNDVFDRDVDRVNHPTRPIPSGQIAPQRAFDFALFLFILAILVSLFINLAAFALVLLSLALMIAYEERFKASGWSGNLLIAWLVGSLFLFAGLCVYDGKVRPLQIAASLAVLAGLSTVGREIVKDIEDVAGDVGRTTLPKQRGLPFATRAAQASLALAVILSAVPAVVGILSVWYILVVVAADAIFVYAAALARRSAATSERAMKVAMAVALAAFLVGGL